MTKEKLERAHEILNAINFSEKQLRYLKLISAKSPNDRQSFFLWAGDQITIPKELDLPITAMLESYYRKELEKAEKEFEEI